MTESTVMAEQIPSWSGPQKPYAPVPYVSLGVLLGVPGQSPPRPRTKGVNVVWLERQLRRETGERLKQARLANHMSQDEVGRSLGKPRTRQAVARWEQGAEPTLGELRQLAALYGESLDWLLLGIRTAPLGGASLREIFREREAAEADWPWGL